MVDKREKIRRESCILEQVAFTQKCEIRDKRKILGLSDDPDGFFMFVKRIKRDPPLPKVVLPLGKLKKENGRGTDSKPNKGMDLLALKMESEFQRRKNQDANWEDVSEVICCANGSNRTFHFQCIPLRPCSGHCYRLLQLEHHVTILPQCLCIGDALDATTECLWIAVPIQQPGSCRDY